MSNTVNKHNRIRSFIVPNLFATILLVIICVVPLFDRDLPHVFKLGIFLLWSLTALSVGKIRKGQIGRGVLVGWFLYLALQLFYSIIGYSRELTFFLARCYIYVIPIAMVFVTRFYNVKELKVVWNSIIIVFAICLIDNFFLGYQGEETFDLTSETKGSNAGSTAFVSGCMFIIPALWMLIRKGRLLFRKIISGLLIIGCVVYMFFLNSRATVLVVFAIMILGLFIADRSERKYITPKKMIIWMVITLLASVIIAAPVLSKLAELFGDGDAARMSDRLEDLAYAASGGDIMDLGRGSLFYRVLLWQTSINTFLGDITHFFIGIGENKIKYADLQDLISSGVGNHSEFFDLAARYGLVGIIIYVNMIKKTFRYMIDLAPNEWSRNSMIALMTSMIIYSFFNVLTAQACSLVMLFLFLPITMQLYKYKKI